MEILNQLALALGFATLAGLNLYMTVFITGLAIRMNWVELSTQYEQLSVLGHDGVLIASGIFFALEFFSDKIPWVDSLWDSVHTLIRPIGGGLLAIRTLGATDPAFDVIIGLLAGSTALVSHGFKAGTRLIVNASPEPVSNILVSTAENVAVAGGLALMAWNPLVAAAVFIAFLSFAMYVTPRLFRRSKAYLWMLWHKFGSLLGHRADSGSPRLYARLSSDDDLALAGALGSGLVEPLWSARVLVAKAKGFRAIPGFTFGKLVAVEGSSGVIHFVGRRFWRSFHCAIPLTDMTITQEPRFLSEDIVACSRNGSKKLVFKIHSGQRLFAERLVEVMLEIGGGKAAQAKSAGAVSAFRSAAASGPVIEAEVVA